MSGGSLAGRTKCRNLAFCPVRSESTGRTALRKTMVRILQKAFSHRASLCRWTLDRAEKLQGDGAWFSWECAFQVLQSGIDMKAFCKSVTTMMIAREIKSYTDNLLPRSVCYNRQPINIINERWSTRISWPFLLREAANRKSLGRNGPFIQKSLSDSRLRRWFLPML